jgi:hypothetical protein
MPELELRPHPATPCPSISAVTARIDWLSANHLVLYYRVEGDIDALQLPTPQRSAHADELWKQTCFEAFLKAPGAAPYFELNFSPSSEWAVYRFEDYRRDMQALAPEEPPRVLCRRRGNALAADVDVHLRPLDLDGGDLEAALCAVLRDQQGACSYWALAHAEGAPDFHHPSGFAITIARPPSA